MCDNPTPPDPSSDSAEGLSLSDLFRNIEPILSSGADAGLSEAATSVDRVMPRYHTQPDYILLHHISQDDLTKIRNAGDVLSDSSVLQFTSGAAAGLVAPFLAAIWKAIATGGLASLEAAEIISSLLAIFSIGASLSLVVVRKKSKRKSVGDICTEIEERKRHLDR